MQRQVTSLGLTVPIQRLWDSDSVQNGWLCGWTSFLFCPFTIMTKNQNWIIIYSFLNTKKCSSFASRSMVLNTNIPLGNQHWYPHRISSTQFHLANTFTAFPRWEKWCTNPPDDRLVLDCNRSIVLSATGKLHNRSICYLNPCKEISLFIGLH